MISADSYDNPWTFDDTPITSSDIGDYYGFVYLITNLKTNEMYVGRKYFWKLRKPKTKDKKRRVKSESDWKDYYGSCKRLLEAIADLGKQNFRREIISLHKTKGDVNYSEIKEQFKRDVLEKRDNNRKVFYNDNIMSRYFIVNNDSNRKISQKLKCPPIM